MENEYDVIHLAKDFPYFYCDATINPKQNWTFFRDRCTCIKCLNLSRSKQESEVDMCEKCEKAIKILAEILPYREGPEKLREWAVKQQSTEVTRMVACYLVLTQEDRKKKLNTERLLPGILASIRGNLSPDLDEDYTYGDEKINRMGNDELFGRFLIWYGIIGYEVQIKNAVENIFGIKLED